MEYKYDENGEVNIKFNIDEQIEYKNLDPFVLLQPREIGISIAYNLFDAEYDIKEKHLDEEINDYLKNLHEAIFEEAVSILFDNGVDVL